MERPGLRKELHGFCVLGVGRSGARSGLWSGFLRGLLGLLPVLRAQETNFRPPKLFPIGESLVKKYYVLHPLPIEYVLISDSDESQSKK